MSELGLGLGLFRHLCRRCCVAPGAAAAVGENLLSLVALARIGLASGLKRGWWDARCAVKDAGLLRNLIAHVEEGGLDVAELDLALVDVLQQVVVPLDLHFVVIWCGREVRETFLSRISVSCRPQIDKVSV